jgi:uncharacterized damage-inducible protein DinB
LATTDPTDILLKHDAWATGVVLGLCEKISRDQFHQKFAIGLGSLHENLTHVISATRRWTDRLAGRTPRAMLHALPQYPHLPSDAKERTPRVLRGLLEEAAADLARVVAQSRARGFADVVSLEWAGADGVKKRFTFTHGVVIVHVCTHAMHHRAQCLNMLRQLGVPGVSDCLPDVGATDWSSSVEVIGEVV